MKSKLPVPTAKDINEAHRLARSAAESAVEWAVKCGNLLKVKKDETQRGEFDVWVRKNCNFSRSSAYAYMKVATKSSRGLDDLKSIQQALGYEKPKAKALIPEPQVISPPAVQGPETGNQQKAQVLGIGDAVMTAEARSAETAPSSAAKLLEVTPAPDFDFSGYEPEDDDDYKTNIENVMMADDKLAAMHEELKQAHREMQGLRASRDHYQSEVGAAVRLVKARDRDIEKLKKELAKAKEENESLRERVAIMEQAA